MTQATPEAADAAPIRVAIVDDHPVVRDGTAALLATQPGIAISGTAGSLEEARGLLAATDADVVLLDIRLGTESGLNLLAAGEGPRPAIVVLTAYDYPQYAEAALRLGAAGFVLKTAPMAELLDAIRRAAGGGLAFGVRPRAADRAGPPGAALRGPIGGQKLSVRAPFVWTVARETGRNRGLRLGDQRRGGEGVHHARCRNHLGAGAPLPPGDVPAGCSNTTTSRPSTRTSSK